MLFVKIQIHFSFPEHSAIEPTIAPNANDVGFAFFFVRANEAFRGRDKVTLAVLRKGEG